MKNRYLHTMLAAALMFAGCTADFNEQVLVDNSADTSDKILNSSTKAIAGSIIVRFTPEAESRLATRAALPGATRTGIVGVDDVLDKVNASAVEQIFIVNDMTRDNVYAEGLHLWYELRFDNEADLDVVAKELANVAEVERVQFSHRLCRLETPKVISAAAVEGGATECATRAAKTDIPFNDPYAKYLWNIDNQGANSMVTYTNLFTPVVDADVNAVPAWKLCMGDPSIIVAVVDEGVMYTHEDLKANICINKAERNGTAGVDDDGNGYVDDVYGYNFVNNSSKIGWVAEGDTGHGTHVAGIVSATNNNKIGISSVAGGSGKNDGVKMFSVQTFDGVNGATTSNTARAMQYCAIRGAHIMQCSWGYPSGTLKNDNEFRASASIEANAIDYFVKYGGGTTGPLSGGLAIFAAGNELESLPGYPAAYENCICVTSIGPSLKPAFYTNHGYGADIGAPGGEQFYGNGQVLSSVPAAIATAEKSEFTNYVFYQGTSMACPMVSSVAALGLSYANQLGKRYTSTEFRSMLLSSSNNFDPFFTGALTLTTASGQKLTFNYPTYKGKMGSGYVDAYKLLLNVEGTPYVTVKAGETVTIDLATYFGGGVGQMAYKGVEAAAEEINEVGLVVGGVSSGKLTLTCSNPGCVTVKVKMLQGGNEHYNSSSPYPVEVERTFVVMSKSVVASNNGWL